MKKLLSILLAVSMLLTFAACGAETKSVPEYVGNYTATVLGENFTLCLKEDGTYAFGMDLTDWFKDTPQDTLKKYKLDSVEKYAAFDVGKYTVGEGKIYFAEPTADVESKIGFTVALALSLVFESTSFVGEYDQTARIITCDSGSFGTMLFSYDENSYVILSTEALLELMYGETADSNESETTGKSETDSKKSSAKEDQAVEQEPSVEPEPSVEQEPAAEQKPEVKTDPYSGLTMEELQQCIVNSVSNSAEFDMEWFAGQNYEWTIEETSDYCYTVNFGEPDCAIYSVDVQYNTSNGKIATEITEDSTWAFDPGEPYEQIVFTGAEKDALDYLISTLPWYNDFVAANPVSEITTTNGWDWEVTESEDNKWDIGLVSWSEMSGGYEYYATVSYDGSVVDCQAKLTHFYIEF